MSCLKKGTGQIVQPRHRARNLATKGRRQYTYLFSAHLLCTSTVLALKTQWGEKHTKRQYLSSCSLQMIREVDVNQGIKQIHVK